MRKILLVLLVVGLVLGGCGIKSSEQSQVDQKAEISSEIVLRAFGDNLVELSINSDSKVSAVDFKVKTTGTVNIIGFESNKQVFNSELANGGTETIWSVSLGAMTATKDLPSGRIVLGKIKYSGMGKLVVAGMKMIGPGAGGGSPVEVLLKDVEYDVKNEN